MDEDSDLRTFVTVLLGYWKWIAGVVLVAAIVAYLASSLIPRTYEASAIVVATQPRYQIQLDPEAQAAQEWKPAYQALPTLATSDDILQAVVDGYEPSPQARINDWRLVALRDMAEASTGLDPTLLLLKVRSRSAQDSSALANLWAGTLVRVGNELYGGSQADVRFLEKQVTEASQALERASQALVDYEATNQAGMLTIQLDSLHQAQTEQLTSQRTLGTIIQDLQGLRDQLETQTSTEPAALADVLTALLLQIRAFNASAAEGMPIQLQISDTSALSNRSPKEQASFLEEMMATLQSKSAQIDGQLAAMEPEILSVQKRLQQASLEQDRLTRRQELARDTYLTLARQLDETRVVVQEEYGMFQVGSKAAAPEKPVAPRKVFNTILAGLLALTVGVAGALAFDYWQQGKTQTGKTDADTQGGTGSSEKD